MRPLIAGNWKMNGRRADQAWVLDLAQSLGPHAPDVLICPPATLIGTLAQALAGTAVGVGGQDCRPEPAGAYTGDLSAEHLADMGAVAVILGHSERRQGHGESDDLIRTKIEAAWRAGLMAILCLGETLAEREAGQALTVIEAQARGSLPRQLSGALAIAYEPVWAIGTGKSASEADVLAAHGFLRGVAVDHLGQVGQGVRLLYGGSVKPDNAGRLLALEHVNGALVGGASLNLADFQAIIDAAPGA